MRFIFVRIVLTAIAFLLAAGGVAYADDFPSKPVKIVTGGVAGGSNDATLRAFAGKLRVILRQDVIVENRPGAFEFVGMSMVQQAEADGYTVYWGSSGITTLPVLLKAAANVDVVRDFAPISLIVMGRQVLLVHTKTPYQSVDELIVYMRQNPGKVNFAVGPGSLLAATWLKSATKTDFALVRYSGGTQGAKGVMSGDVDVTTAAIGPAITARDTGKVRLIGITGTKRHELLPNVPALGESAMPEVKALVNDGFGSYWLGLFAPARTPRSVIAYLSEAVAQTVKDPELALGMRRFDLELVGSKPEEFVPFLGKEMARWKAIAKEIGLEPQ